MKKDISTSKYESLTASYKSIEKLVHGITTGIKVTYLAKVVKYDKDKHIADILPLANSSDGEVSAQFLEVPVAEQCYIIDEIIERMKPELKKADANSKLPEHQETHFVNKLPKKKFMRNGVPVVVAVLDRDNDNWAGGNDASNYTPNTGRLHDPNDSVIIGVLGGNAVDG